MDENHTGREVIETLSAVIADAGGFPVKLCQPVAHTHKVSGVDQPCRSAGKRPIQPQWEQGSPKHGMRYIYDWLDKGLNIGWCLDHRLVGLDEDQLGGLDRFFGALGEDIPVTLGDIVPLTRKRHLVMKVPEGFDMSRLKGTFYDSEGKAIGELIHSRTKQLVAPGNPWTNSDLTMFDFRVWNGVSDIVEMSAAAAEALVPPNERPRAYETNNSSSEWQWNEEDDEARHILLRNKNRELAGTIRDVKTLADVTWAWGEAHGLTGMAKGREVTYDEVFDLSERVLRKYEPDPPPITLNVPSLKEWQEKQQQEQQQEQQQQQTASLDTLFTLPYGTPPPPLVQDMFIAAEGWTVLYANGGSGKGLLALWMAHEYLLANPEAQVCVIDYEAHQWEWGNRARAMQWTDDELKRVLYVNPYDDVWKKGHTLDGLAPSLAPLTKRLDIGLYVVDSFATGVKAGSDMGGADSAVGFFKAGAQLGAPGLVLAHTAATTERFPSKPFGSSHIHNQARETWAQAKTDVIEMGPKKGQFGVTSTVMQVELANKKRSVGAQPLGRQGFDIEFTSLGAIEVRWNGAQGASVSQMVLDVLATAARGMTVKALRDAIAEDTGVEVSRNTLEHTVRSMSDRGDVDVIGDSRPKVYGLPSE